jgi:phosphoserine phosphatase RsbU/P
MDGTRALIVADPSEATQALVEALEVLGVEVAQIVFDDLAVHAEQYGVPDLVLVSAGLGLKRLSLANLEFAADGQVPPTMVFLEDDDYELLELCTRAGYDYVAQPFRPSLLRSRLATCLERGELTLTVEEMSAVASLQKYERELRIAHEIQSGFLPDRLPVLDGWQLATGFRPAREVAGDFYDVFELVNEGRIALVVADVCDKGVGAALFMALIRTLLRHTAEHTDEIQAHIDDDLAAAVDGAVRAGVVLPSLPTTAGPLVQAVIGTNRYLVTTHVRQAYFATLFFGLLDPDTGSLLYINGGHNPPVLARADGSWSLLAPTGPAVGMLQDSVYSLGHVVLGPGDSLFVYTDGVVEARNGTGAFFGMDRLTDIVGQVTSADSAQGLVDLVDKKVKRHVGPADQYDDITMLAVRNLGVEPVCGPIPASPTTARRAG